LPGAPSNRIFTFAWDADDRLRAVREGTPDRFLAKYDEDGLRRWTSEGWSLPTGQPVVNEYTWGPGGMVHSSNPNTLYVLGTGRRSNGQYRWFQLDWLGSTRSLTDAAGNTTSEQRYEALGRRGIETASGKKGCARSNPRCRDCRSADSVRPALAPHQSGRCPHSGRDARTGSSARRSGRCPHSGKGRGRGGGRGAGRAVCALRPGAMG
jgi:hypothetical protein